jgi:hypothetical protein
MSVNFAEDFNDALVAFARNNVDFLVVGGYAVNFYGFDRSTGDLDIWIKPSEENKKKIYDTLISIGYPADAAKQVFELNFNQPCCFKLGDEKYPIDIFTHLVGATYTEAEPEKILFQVEENTNIYFIGMRHLIINKMMAGRDKDKIDVDALQKIVQFKK